MMCGLASTARSSRTGRCSTTRPPRTGGGSPARGAIPGTTAELDASGTWRLTGEKTWTTWLPALAHAFVTARLPGEEGVTPEVGTFLVDLAATGVERAVGFEALGMRGSASGRLVLDGRTGELVQRRRAGGRDPRGARRGAWFGSSMAAVYLGVGEGARAEVVRWASERRPGDGSTAVAEIPSVQLRLGRMDAELRAARIVVLATAESWDRDRRCDGCPAGQTGRDPGGRDGHGRGAADRRRPRVPAPGGSSEPSATLEPG